VQPVAPDDPRLPSRPGWALLILALPLVGVVLTALAYAVTWAVGLQGRSADGEAVTLTYAGCVEAGPVVEARLRDMGLAPRRTDTADGFVVDVVLPADPEVAARIPETLAARGQLEVRGEGVTLAGPEDIVDASVRMDLMMVPSTLVKVGPEAAAAITTHVRSHPTGVLQFRVDGVEVGTQSNQNPVTIGELELSPPTADGRARWEAVAAWSVTVDHPLPCPISRR
jgi:hypothetical protein